MEGASFEKFCSVMDDLSGLKKQYPHFKIRINYTVNRDNLEELAGFFDVFEKYHIDVLQLRPIQNMGNTKYHDFSWDKIYAQYDAIIQKLKDISKEKNITCIAPGKKNLIEDIINSNTGGIANSTYCYISPRTIWEDDFDLSKDTFESYAGRSHLGKKLFLNIFRKRKNYATKKGKLNYEIK
jgi:MoaA/NifB/PqqE/SkfB family radical SAM enzyme